MRTAHWAALLLVLFAACPAHAIVTEVNDTASDVTWGDVVDGVNFSGVVEISDSSNGTTYECSGSLLSDGYSILTAGHCVTTAYGASTYTNIVVTFMGPNGAVSETVSNVEVDPGYTGDSTQGSDLAILTLSQQAPSFAVGYSLYSDPSLVSGTPLILAGYGLSGDGTTGADGSFGTLQEGTNEYVENGSAASGGSWSSQLMIGQFYDPCNSSTNVLGVAHPYSGTTGRDACTAASTEVDISPGDSGGPTFYDGEIVGVHDLGVCETDVTTGDCAEPPAEGSANNSYYGDLFADTSVANNLTFIEDAEVPEPRTFALLGLGFALLGFAGYRRRLRTAHRI